VDNILLIFSANVFQNVRVRKKFLSELDAEGLGIHLGIVNGDLDRLRIMGKRAAVDVDLAVGTVGFEHHHDLTRSLNDLVRLGNQIRKWNSNGRSTANKTFAGSEHRGGLRTHRDIVRLKVKQDIDSVLHWSPGRNRVSSSIPGVRRKQFQHRN
jgi:hypothetical protein